MKSAENVVFAMEPSEMLRKKCEYYEQESKMTGSM